MESSTTVEGSASIVRPASAPAGFGPPPNIGARPEIQATESELVAPWTARRHRSLRGVRIPTPSPSLTRFVLVPLVVVVLWQLACSLHVVNQALVASPVQVVKAAARLSSQGVLWPDVGISVRRALLGFLVGLTLGSALGVTAGLWRRAESVIDTPMQVLNTLPFLALVPLFILWFGIGEESKVALITIGSAVPIYLNLVTAIRNVDVRLVEMALTLGVSRRRLVLQVLLPGALPGALVGLRMALAFSVIGLVAAEQINATSGIGYMMQQASNYFQTDVLFVGFAFYALFGLAAAAFVTLLERIMLAWQPRFSGR